MFYVQNEIDVIFIIMLLTHNSLYYFLMLNYITYGTKDFISMALNTTKYCNTNICLDVPQPQRMILRYR
jgi:hypothetical protein